MFNQNKIPLKSSSAPGLVKTLVLKSYLKSVCFQPLRILGLTHGRAGPVLSHLANFIHWSCAYAQLGCKVGENYYFQMFLPEVAWSRSEPRDRMLGFYSWLSCAPSARDSPVPTPTPLCQCGKIREIGKTSKTDKVEAFFFFYIKWFSQQDDEAVWPPAPWLLVHQALLKLLAIASTFKIRRNFSSKINPSILSLCSFSTGRACFPQDSLGCASVHSAVLKGTNSFFC